MTQPSMTIALASVLLLGVADVRTRDDPPTLWQYKPDGEFVQWFGLTPLGKVMVKMPKAFRVLDPATGAVVWERADLANIAEPDTRPMPFTSIAIVHVPLTPSGSASSDSTAEAVADQHEAVDTTLPRPGFRDRISHSAVWRPSRLEAIDLETGKTQWTVPGVDGRATCGYIVATHGGIVLFALSDDPRTYRRMLAVDAKTGAVIWDRKQMFKESIRYLDQPVDPRFPIDIKERTLFGVVPPVFDSDSTVILYLNAEGPTRININTGARLWTATLVDDTPPLPDRGFAPPLLEAGVLYVANEKTLHAIRVSDGAFVWSDAADNKGRPRQMNVTPDGLLVRGGFDTSEPAFNPGTASLTMFDPASGQVRWRLSKKEISSTPTAYALAGDHVYLSGDGHLLSVSTRSGEVTALADVRLKDERALRVEARGETFLVSGSQSIVRLKRDGTEEYRVYFPVVRPAAWMRAITAVATAMTNVGLQQSAQARANSTGSPVYYQTATDPLARVTYQATQVRADYIMVMTDVEDATGKGAGIVRVSKETGKIDRRMRLEAVDTQIRIDEVEGRVFQQIGSRLVAYSF